MNNRLIQEKLENVVGVYGVRMSERVQQQEEDFSSFRDYASKGFISLDRSEDNGEKPHYHRVAFPINGETFGNEELLRLMPLLNDNEIEIEE